MADLEGNIPFPTSSTGRRLAEYARAQAEGVRAARGTHPLPPDAIRGYSLVSQLHWGGQGEVYEAIQTATKRRVAIKLMHLRAWSNVRSRARFEQEMEVLGKLKHPNIVAVHDGGVSTSGRYFLVMDLIDGEPLDEWLADKEATVHQTLVIFSKVCSAVNAAHVHGIAHRDLKPSNIIMDASGEPYVLDFGLSKLVLDEIDDIEGDDKTSEGEFLGSIPWASPEQAECTPGLIDLRTDVYSLGVVLFRILTGHTPYGVVGPLPEVFSNIRNFQPLRPSVFRPEIDDDVDTIVLKCLNKERERRYQTAGELGRDIESYLRGEPIDAKRDSTWYVMTRTMLRHRRVVAAALAFVSLLAVGLIATSALYLRSVSAERDAKRRYEELHELARSVILDFDAQLRKGPTAAREFYVSTALPYLNGLGSEAPKDPDLLADLIAGYVKVADVQGNGSYPNLGHAAGALKTLEIAKRLAELGQDVFPSSPKVRAALATVYERLGDMKYYAVGSDTRDAMKTFEWSLMIREKLVQQEPSNTERIRDLASILLRIGNIELELGHRESAKAAYMRSLEWRKRWLELEPANPDAALWLARNYRAIGDAEYSPENGDEAGSWYAKAQHALDSRFLAQADAEVQHERIRLQHRFGRHEANRGEQVSALRHFLACKEVTDATLLADPEDLRAREDGWLCGDEAAKTLALLGRYPEAVEHAEANLALAKDVNRRGAAKKNLLQIIAFSHGRLGQVLFETGDLPNALDNFKRSSEILESLNASDGDTLRWKHSLTDVYHRLAVTCTAMAESGYTEEDLQCDARTYVTKGLSVLASLPVEDEKRRHVEWSGELECKLTETASKLDEELSVDVR